MYANRLSQLSALVCGLAVLPLAACSPAATVEPAPEAADPECASIMLALPEEIGEFQQRETTSQGTSAWGDPSRVVLRCGVEPPGPQPEHCVTAEGVDWLAVEDEDNSWTLTSYGREPAVEVLLEVDEVASSTVMVSLASAVERVDQTRECTSVDQAIDSTEDS